MFTIKPNAINCTTMNEKVDIYYEYVILVEHIHYIKLAPDSADDMQEKFSVLFAALFAMKESDCGQTEVDIVKLDEGSIQFRLRKIIENL